ncbi:uracil-DNA glycosylase family protein [Mesorhizobium sp. CN5-321]|jgi:hypothetical protein|uniref:uracil-DNA glycosylase family protein n=1 Tax=Mesorhizobium hunchu TaxID=3157708 RepID=UPI0032B77F44
MDADSIRRAIGQEYIRRGHRLGWRLLASPWKTTERADIAFLGINPGGGSRETDHGELSTENGSAYEIEAWAGYPAGASPLQKQVRGLFETLGVAARDVLAGNLVPFRSPNINALPDRQAAVEFGIDLWTRLLATARPKLVIGMGGDTHAALLGIAGISPSDVETKLSGWGTVRVKRAAGGRFDLAMLPHLSRFQIVGHPRCDDAVRWALEPFLSRQR